MKKEFETFPVVEIQTRVLTSLDGIEYEPRFASAYTNRLFPVSEGLREGSVDLETPHGTIRITVSAEIIEGEESI